eukprot:EG_transcript_32432
MTIPPSRSRPCLCVVEKKLFVLKPSASSAPTQRRIAIMGTKHACPECIGNALQLSLICLKRCNDTKYQPRRSRDRIPALLLHSTFGPVIDVCLSLLITLFPAPDLLNALTKITLFR